MEVNEPMGFYGTLARNPVTMMMAIEKFSEAGPTLEFIKENTKATDDLMAYWLNVNVKTYRAYRQSGAALKPDTIEHILMLKALTERGLEVIGSAESFGQWLVASHFHFGGKRPADYLNTISGIRFMDDLLVNMEFGVNA
jgi:uncharacterized protein (DUF2384 family)